MIKVLDQNTIDKIAAGEVIERPMSVVKELVENSIDAGASMVTVEIKDGGTSFIRVTDNGSGIDKDDIRRAYMSHATSKLTSADDLVGINTLGFRGEALSTIAAVTHTEMITKTADSLTGIKYVIEGGKEIELKEIGAPQGTTIIAKNIFYNTPVRLKFLKTNMTEGSYINDLVSHIALSHPEVSITLISNGKTIVDTAGNNKIKECIYKLYGRDIANSLLDVNYTEGRISVKGYVGKPFLARGNRSFENYFVNGRYIKSPVINRAIEEAYKTYIMQHKFPFTVLFIDLPKEECDVNIHPAKREFKYGNEKELFTAIYHAVADGLANREMIPNSEVDYGQKDKHYAARPEIKAAEKKQESHIEQFRSTLDKTNTLGSTYTSVKSNNDHSNKTTGTSSYSILESLLPESFRNKLKEADIEESTETNTEAAREHTKFHVNESDKEILTNEAAFDNNKETVITSTLDDIRTAEQNNIEAARINTDTKETSKEAVRENTDTKVTSKEAVRINADTKAAINEDVKEDVKYTYQQESLKDVAYLSAEAFEKHRIIGQVFDTYWLSEYDGSLYIMDQHAAHEKLNYETFLKEFKEREIVSQNLFPPMIITLSAVEKAAVLENEELFIKSGFDISDFGGKDIKISSVPINLEGLSGKDVFLEFANYLSQGLSGVTEDIFIHKIATMGCKAAIKGNQKISLKEAQSLIEKLMTLDNPYTCPHGRPTIIKMTKSDLEKKFKRIVE